MKIRPDLLPGYSAAIAALRDRGRYAAWHQAQAVGPGGARSRLDVALRDVAADYLADCAAGWGAGWATYEHERTTP